VVELGVGAGGTAVVAGVIVWLLMRAHKAERQIDAMLIKAAKERIRQLEALSESSLGDDQLLQVLGDALDLLPTDVAQRIRNRLQALREGTRPDPMSVPVAPGPVEIEELEVHEPR
jgi:hypothetical protein